jgi:hypothetical protein
MTRSISTANILGHAAAQVAILITLFSSFTA